MSKSINKKLILLTIFVLLMLILVITISTILLGGNKSQTPMEFDADLAYQHVVAQMEFGPRTPGSDAHSQARAYIIDELKKDDWKVEVQESEALGHPLYNIIAKRGNGPKWVILGAHYDNRLVADRGEISKNQPVPGANDGASGVAVLLELARVLPVDLETETWLVFFDLEDQGRIEGWDWILGSTAFVNDLRGKPDAVVVIDMIGDADLNIYREKSSTIELVDEIWGIASELGYDEYFIDKEKYGILDDHTPFLNAGIRAIDIIDFDYPYWHTLEDTADKVSPHSLKVVGDILLTWLTR